MINHANSMVHDCSKKTIRKRRIGRWKRSAMQKLGTQILGEILQTLKNKPILPYLRSYYFRGETIRWKALLDGNEFVKWVKFNQQAAWIIKVRGLTYPLKRGMIYTVQHERLLHLSRNEPSLYFSNLFRWTSPPPSPVALQRYGRHLRFFYKTHIKCQR